jgi:hypothetical protein
MICNFRLFQIWVTKNVQKSKSVQKWKSVQKSKIVQKSHGRIISRECLFVGRLMGLELARFFGLKGTDSIPSIVKFGTTGVKLTMPPIL